MVQEYLPGKLRDRIRDLMKERGVNQNELAQKAGITESTLSRFLSGSVSKLSDENIVAIARYFDVSTDFLLGLASIPDRTNYEIAELGLSVGAAISRCGGQQESCFSSFNRFDHVCQIIVLLHIWFGGFPH